MVQFHKNRTRFSKSIDLSLHLVRLNVEQGTHIRRFMFPGAVLDERVFTQTSLFYYTKKGGHERILQ